MCTDMQIRMQNTEQRAVAAQWRCVVLQSGFIGFYAVDGSIPLVKTHCLGSMEQQLQQLQCSGFGSESRHLPCAPIHPL